jgi:23S rRNA (guanosine2251-2'-O)-methyltransferase
MIWRKRTPAELTTEANHRRGVVPITLLLHNIRSQYNVGAILRTADAVGVQAVVCSGYTPQPGQKGVDKTALRGLETLAWSSIPDPQVWLAAQKAQGVKVYGLEQCHGSMLYHQVRYDFPAILVVGEEVSGVDESLLSYCDQMVEIPMFGAAHSLNVSVATSVLMYQMLLQWQK